MKNKTALILLVIAAFLLTNHHGFAQIKIGDNPTSIHPSAMLEVEDDAKGVLLVRMNSTQIAAISNPATGLLVFNTQLNCLQIQVGAPATPNWQCLVVANSNEWVYDATNGKTYARRPQESSNSNIAVTDAGNLGVGTTNPFEKLVVNGAIKLGAGAYDGITDGATTPVPQGGAGTIAFASSHFFLWDGDSWEQLDN